MTSSKQTLSVANWEALIQECDKSSESQASFCKHKGLRYTSFCYWRSRLKLKRSKVKSQAKAIFKEAAILTMPTEEEKVATSKEISVYVGDKIKLVFDISLLPETLRLLQPLLGKTNVNL